MVYYDYCYVYVSGSPDRSIQLGSYTISRNFLYFDWCLFQFSGVIFEYVIWVVISHRKYPFMAYNINHFTSYGPINKIGNIIETYIFVLIYSLGNRYHLFFQYLKLQIWEFEMLFNG